MEYKITEQSGNEAYAVGQHRPFDDVQFREHRHEHQGDAHYMKRFHDKD